MESMTSRVGKRGVLTIPARLRKTYGMVEGSLVIAEDHRDGILLRPAVATPVEMYSDERIAEFLLTNTADEQDYQAARQEVEAMGVDPDSVRHAKPS